MTKEQIIYCIECSGRDTNCQFPYSDECHNLAAHEELDRLFALMDKTRRTRMNKLYETKEEAIKKVDSIAANMLCPFNNLHECNNRCLVYNYEHEDHMTGVMSVTGLCSHPLFMLGLIQQEECLHGEWGMASCYYKKTKENENE